MKKTASVLAVLFVNRCPNYLFSNILVSATQSTKNIALALAVIAPSLLDFACSIATRTLHLSSFLALVALFSHDVILLICVIFSCIKFLPAAQSLM